MCVVNASPEWFGDAGASQATDQQMAEAGAEIIDIEGTV